MRGGAGSRPDPAAGTASGSAGPETRGPRSATHRTEAELIRVLLANDERLDGIPVRSELFADPALRSAAEQAMEMIDGLEPGEVPDLGSVIGSDESQSAELLRTLAMDAMPLADPRDLVNMLEIAAIDRDIEAIRRELQHTDESADEQAYSELWQRLIALEQMKRERRRDRDT
jgi:hypothetical protein